MSRLKNFIKEEWMNTYKYSLVPGLSNSVDVFVNPSRKEFREVHNNNQKYSRFVLDNKKKKLYIWSGTEALHREMWTEISKDIGDSRQLYISPDLLVGTIDFKGNIEFESNFIYPLSVWEKIYNTNWSWANKYMKKITKTLKGEPKNGI